jgi:hypothetical protein
MTRSFDRRLDMKKNGVEKAPLREVKNKQLSGVLGSAAANAVKKAAATVSINL